MLRVEATAPGFAGYYLDADENLVLLLKRGSAASHARVRALVDDTYVNAQSRVVRALMADARTAPVRPATYSLSELVDFEQRLLNSPLVRGVAGMGVQVQTNTVALDLISDADAAALPAALTALGIPASAVSPVVAGPVVATGTWQDQHRPTKSGIKIEFYDGRWDPNPQTSPPTRVAFVQSLGYNVRLDDQPGQPNAFLTVAHGVNAWEATNGATGTVVYQPYYPYPMMGTITHNPAWQTGSACSANGISFDFCTTADVALGTYASGITYLRAVGTSTYQGDDGAAGSQTVNGAYAITDVVPVDMVPTSRRNIFKSGMTTGTTSGTMGVSHYFAMDTLLGWGNPANHVLKRALFWEQVRVDSMGFGFGDSGGAGFVHLTKNSACSPYCALGMESSGRGALNPLTGICSAGKNCSVVFSHWSEIQFQLAKGVLNPKTNP